MKTILPHIKYTHSGFSQSLQYQELNSWCLLVSPGVSLNESQPIRSDARIRLLRADAHDGCTPYPGHN